jgi:hypothetical protein
MVKATLTVTKGACCHSDMFQPSLTRRRCVDLLRVAAAICPAGH